MTTLKFADTHNIVAFLSKLVESEGFEQIMDFLNAHPIKHALTVNPKIYTSCIEQFWATVKAKTVNGEVQLQDLVDEKKIIITESTVRRDLQLEDAEGVDCLPNATIFEQLALIGFVQVFLDKQLEGMSNHNRIYVTPSHTKKIFGNKKKVREMLSGRETPLFPTMVPQSSVPSDNVADEAIYKELDGNLVRAATTASSLEAKQDSGNIIKTRSKATPNEASSERTTSWVVGNHTSTLVEASLKLKELMDLCTNLQQRVLDLEKTKAIQAEKIISLKRRDKKLEQKKRSRTHGLKRLYKVGLTARVESSGDEKSLALAALRSVKPKVKANVIEELSVPVSVASASTKVSVATTTITTIPTPRKGIVIAEQEELVKTKKKDLIRLDEEIASKLQAEFDEEERLAREKDEANVVLTEEWDDIQAKVDADYQLAERLQVEEQEQFPLNPTSTFLDDEEVQLMLFLLAVKLQALLTGKFPRGKKNYYQISGMMESLRCISLLVILLKDFTGRLKLWEIGKKDTVWRNQQDYRVLDWKLYDSCGVYSLRMQHMHIHMLVEKRYPLTPATITDMLNKESFMWII
ncbi:hypothetical protein Tco_0881811 [Tanacetum coccineum]